MKRKFDSVVLTEPDFNNAGMMLLTERGLLRVLTLSKAEKALAFQDFIVDEILPSIMKTGSFNAHHAASTSDA